MRQFGFQQLIPHLLCTPPQVHHLTLRGKHVDHWTVVIDGCTNVWNNRRNSCFQRTVSQEGLLSSQSDYMRWFANIAEQIVYYTSDEVACGLALLQLNIYDVADGYVESVASAPHPGQAVDIPPLPVPRSSREAKGPCTRRRVELVHHIVPLVHERLPEHNYGPAEDTGVYPSQSQEVVHHDYPPAQPYIHPTLEYHVSPHHVPAHDVQAPPSYPPVTDAWLSDPPPAWMQDAAAMLFSPEPTRLGVDLKSHFSGEASSSARVVTPTVRRNPHRLARTMQPPCGTSQRPHGHAQHLPSHDDNDNDDDEDD
ncbi:hypothetical protein Fmac_024711 [Flemingia macrophylla]|uniref:Uncharacterized protein n=1 Tax=Flemingia macrophylla TaxID=520843 RepID=A0ABD1LQP5_9FABA